MKKIYASSALCFLFSICLLHAQIEKKEFLLGASLGGSTSSANNSPTNSNVNISPRIGYAIGNNSLLYANFGYSYFKSTSNIDGSNSKGNSFNAGISWKRFIAIKENFGLFTSLNATFGTGKSTQETGTPLVKQENRSNSYTFGLIPGVYFLPAHWLILNVDAGGLIYNYSKYRYQGNPASHSSSFNASFLNYFTFSVDFILHKKKKKDI